MTVHVSDLLFIYLPCTNIPYFQIMKLDFQHNELKSIPHCLLQMPNLSGLNLSHNNLESLPDIGKWSTVLNLSHNQLKSFPISVEAPSICSLNISHNNLREVPMCVCSFTTLHSLDLSNNVDILTLPVEMGRLSQIFCVELGKPQRFARSTTNCSRKTKGLHPVPQQQIAWLQRVL